MPQWVSYTLLLLGGLVVLGVGGEFLVRGAGRLARTLGVSALVVGLTVVAFGTSAPEAAVTIYAAASGSTDLAVGNVVGSNIANVLLILGIAALISPLRVSRNLIRFDGPIMVVTAALFLGLALLNKQITRPEGVLFVVGLVAYTLFTYYVGRKPNLPEEETEPPPTGLGSHWWYNLALVVIGITGLVGGARLIVDGASGLATLFGVSEHVIGLTIVAVGTSLPELATVVVAARHRQPDIAIGNVVGSNIFNVLFVTGCASVVHPLPVPDQIMRFDGPVMLGVCALFIPMAATGQRITRWEGGILLALYVGYLTWTGIQAM